MARSLAAWLKAARRRKGVSLSALGRAADLQTSMLSRIESGEQRDIGLASASRICDALGLPLDDMAASMQGHTSEIPEPRIDLAEIARLEKLAQQLIKGLATIKKRQRSK